MEEGQGSSTTKPDHQDRLKSDQPRVEFLFERIKSENITIGEALLLVVFLQRLIAIILNERIFNIYSKAVFDTYVDIAKDDKMNSILSFTLGMAQPDGVQSRNRSNKEDGELSRDDSKDKEADISIQNESS